MKAKNKGVIYTLVAFMVLFFQVVQATVVQADGEIPPPTKSATEVAHTDLPVVDTLVSTPVPSDINSIEEVEPASDAPTLAPVESVTPAPEAEVSNSESTGQPNLLESLQEFPGETNVVVLGENGESVPLAAQEAADALVTNDPVWCPTGQSPTPGANGCSNSYAYLAELISAYKPTGDGVIWIQAGIQGIWNPCSPHWICPANPTIDGTTILGWQSANTYALTLQGGWIGTSGDATIIGNTKFDQPVSIYGWRGNIIVNNIMMMGDELHIDTTQNVAINDSTFNNEMGVGVDVSAHDVIITDSQFIRNSTGLNGNAANITLDCVSYEDNKVNESLGSAVITRIPCSTSEPLPTFLPVSDFNNEIVIVVPPEQKFVEISIDCSQANRFLVKWTFSGDWILMSCVENGISHITRVDNTDISTDLPMGYGYVVGYNIAVLQYGLPLSVLPEGRFIQTSFAARSANSVYDIMAWDEGVTDWKLLSEHQVDVNGVSKIFSFGSPDDDRKILKGTQSITAEGSSREEVIINFPSTLMLTQQ